MKEIVSAGMSVNGKATIKISKQLKVIIKLTIVLPASSSLYVLTCSIQYRTILKLSLLHVHLVKYVYVFHSVWDEDNIFVDESGDEIVFVCEVVSK